MRTDKKTTKTIVNIGCLDEKQKQNLILALKANDLKKLKHFRELLTQEKEKIKEDYQDFLVQEVNKIKKVAEEMKK